ncbi:MAG: hypothetical protein KAH07_08420 [Flavobacteriaceae bacterium]|nr:hypothetical protein [Flavobacteriaceae bacterium]
MVQRSANIFLALALFCVSMVGFSQADEGVQLLKDSDDKLILFENHFFEALKYKAIGNFSRAITELEKCQQLFPNDDSIEFELAKNHFLLDHFTEAQLYIEKALKSKPENYWYLNKAKAVYLKTHNYEQAINIQNKMIELRPETKEDLVLVYILSNQNNKAQLVINELEKDGITSRKLRNYQKAIKKRNNINTGKSTGDVSDLLLVDLKSSYENQKEFKMLSLIMKQEYGDEHFEELRKYSDESLELFPAQPLGYLMKGRGFNVSKEYNLAIDVLNEGLDFIVEDGILAAKFHDQIALSFEGLHQVNKAKKARKKAVELRSN